MKTQRSAELWERALRVAPGGVHSPVRAFRGVGGTPRFMNAAHGAEITDVDGNRYVDWCMAWGPLLFGHADPQVHAAARDALASGWSYGTADTRSLELAELITTHVPWVRRIRFVNSGTEAVMSALRVARAATGRDRVLKFAGCYHGHVDAMLVRAGSGLAEQPEPDSAGISTDTAHATLVAPLDDPAALDAVFQRHGRELAAVVIEPLPANNGLLPQRTEFLQHLVARARACGTLVIFDEVISGFRIAFGGMAEVLGIEPDLVTYGKVIGGGFPVGAYGGRAELMELVAPAGPVYQAGTLSANPVAMAAGFATLHRLLRDPPYALLEERAAQLAARLEAIMAAHSPRAFRVQRFGSLFWPVFGAAGEALETVRAPERIPQGHAAAFRGLFHALLERGHYLAPSAFEVGFLSTAHEPEHIESLARAFEAAVRAGILENVSR